MLVIPPNPILELQHALLPPKSCEQENVLQLLTLPLFHFKLTFEYIQELGNMSLDKPIILDHPNVGGHLEQTIEEDLVDAYSNMPKIGEGIE